VKGKTAMVLGMTLQTFTLVHVLISLAAIASGFVVMYGFLANNRLEGWTALFLTTTAFTSLTGFLFPFKGVTPAIKLGVILLLVLGICILTRYLLHLRLGKNLRDYCLHSIILKCFRSCGAVV
jgi:hypothetical protein